MTMPIWRVPPRLLAAVTGVLAALALCLAAPDALRLLGCAEVGIAAACLASEGVWMLAVQPLVLLTLLVVTALVSGSVAVEAFGHARLARTLYNLARPALVLGEPVRLVAGLGAALVAGLAQPRIYVSTDLAEHLDRDELEAVLLHERHHQQSRAPVRLVVLAGIGRLVGWSRAGRSWLVRQRAAIEIAADAHVLAAGVPRAVLARAIVRLMDDRASDAVPAFASAADLRLRALLHGEPLAADRGPSLSMTALLVFLVACFALA